TGGVASTAGRSVAVVIGGRFPAAVTPPATASAPSEITAMHQSEAGLISRDTGMKAVSTSAKALFAANRPESSGERFSTFAAMIDSIGCAGHQGVGRCN